MGNPNASPLAALYGKLPPGWEAWVGVGGILYARKRRSSPPVVVRAANPDDLRAKVLEKVQEQER